MKSGTFQFSDLKYLAAYINPMLAVFGLTMGGIWTFTNVVFVFVLVPLIDMISVNDPKNLNESDRKAKAKLPLFDWLLYFNLPILFGVLVYFTFVLEMKTLSFWEILGNTWSVGIVIGTCGINVGHELGHRKSRFDQYFAQILLTPALYTHFFIEHNRGHHKHVATPLDPASANKGEAIYTFWLRSVLNGYVSAWNIEKKRLEKKGKKFWSWSNSMVRISVLQLSYIITVFLLLSTKMALLVLLSGIIGVLLLETINYLEHYGLRRNKLASEGYERVLPKHSWNANFSFGRIVLYELTRHSDHHYLASKKYQLLNHHEASPQLPFGYPAMMLVALIPPFWFKMMDPLLPNN